ALQNMDRFNLSFPCMVKPRNEDASHGLSESSVVNSFDMLRRQVKNVSDSFGGSALVEEFLAGREFNATVLGNDKIYVLPVSEIVYSLPREVPRILTFAAKWDVDSPYYKGTQAVCPAEIEKHEHHLITETAIAAFRLLGCRGYARIDMRFNDAGQLNVIEVNPNPDISPDAGAARQALAAGMTYTQFVEKIIQLSLEKEYNAGKNPSHGEKRQTIPGGHFKGYTRVQTV
ncbi:MAG: ATP-grasp domain-containing protein, partial [Dehalococcoidia bacterium]|nr:ATP-grasp domain-containing protein [Dehalococcoidia bacterium]